MHSLLWAVSVWAPLPLPPRRALSLPPPHRVLVLLSQCGLQPAGLPVGPQCDGSPPSLQHHQRLRPAAESGAQTVPDEGAHSNAHRQGTGLVPRPGRTTVGRSIPLLNNVCHNVCVPLYPNPILCLLSPAPNEKNIFYGCSLSAYDEK